MSWSTGVRQIVSTRPSPPVLGLAVLFLTWGTFLTYYQVRFGLNGPPSASGDEPSYDSIGRELSLGNGFRLDSGNPEFRRPYDIAARDSALYRLGPPKAGVTTSRPPLFPGVIALLDLAFGRQFWGVRVFNAFCVAATGGLLAWYLARRRGTAAALMGAFLFVVVDVRTRLYGRAILTEALAMFWVAILCCLLFRFARRRTWETSGLIGAVFGLAVLTRSLFILWGPGLALILFWLAVRRQIDAGGASPAETPFTRLRRAALHPVLFCSLLAVVLLPWGIRNCRITGKFLPLGTQGQTQLSAAFGDEIWKKRGEWPNLGDAGFFDEILHEGMSLLEEELAMARHSRDRAYAWIGQHPGRVVLLVPLKNMQEFRPRNVPEAVLLVLALLGAWRLRNDLDARILLALVATNAVAISCTWSVEGRFLVPLLFAQHVLAAAGLWGLIVLLMPGRVKSAYQNLSCPARGGLLFIVPRGFVRGSKNVSAELTASS